MSQTSGIFISYRRGGTGSFVARFLHDQLSKHFRGEADVFLDVEDIEPGRKFPAAIADALASCDLFVAVIDPEWTSKISQLGDDDYVQREITSALARHVHVVPVLVGVDMPEPKLLPQPVAPLSTLEAVTLSSDNWTTDVTRLVSHLDEVLGAVRAKRGAALSAEARGWSARAIKQGRLRRILEVKLTHATHTLTIHGFVGAVTMNGQPVGNVLFDRVTSLSDMFSQGRQLHRTRYAWLSLFIPDGHETHVARVAFRPATYLSRLRGVFLDVEGTCLYDESNGEARRMLAEQSASP